jgi:hypothetical protein
MRPKAIPALYQYQPRKDQCGPVLTSGPGFNFLIIWESLVLVKRLNKFDRPFDMHCSDIWNTRIFRRCSKRNIFKYLKICWASWTEVVPKSVTIWADINSITYDEQNAEQAELKLCPNLWPFWADISSITYDEQNAEQAELKLCPNPS